ncbi:hypothetical protein R3X25_14685, partial [Lutibacter sp. TH_r2]|uniref:hypothetical protein n=1 Tax=Lutibacter sp. TH_r2 TaxID=3082083 RepID=UPI00295474BD
NTLTITDSAGSLTAPIVNTNELSIVSGEITSTVNGIASTAIALPVADGTETIVTGAGINTVTGDGSSTTPYVVTGTEVDGDITNEIQDISTDATAGNISLTSGSTLTLNVDDADADSTNEIQTLSISGDQLTISGGNTVTLPQTESTLDVTKETIGYVFAAAHTLGDGTNSFNINCSVSRTATGRYTVAFTTAHPNGAEYDITFGTQINSGRDSRIVSVLEQRADGFDVVVVTGDNGTTADTYVDEVWYFNTSATKDVVTGVELVTTTSAGTTTDPTTPTGTPTTDFTYTLNDTASGTYFQLGFNNGVQATSYEILLDNVPYQLTNLTLGDHTVVEQDNGDGTYDYLFTSTSPIGANSQYRQIQGDKSATGSGNSCNCVSFYTL